MQCALCSGCSVQCAVYSVQCVQCTVYSVYSVQCTVYSIQCTVYSVHGIQCTVDTSRVSQRTNTAPCPTRVAGVTQFIAPIPAPGWWKRNNARLTSASIK